MDVTADRVIGGKDMILFFECIISCVLFGLGIVGSVLINKVFWLQEYAPSVQERFLSLHPECRPADKRENIAGIVIKKIIVCLLFVLILLLMVYIAGAKGFHDGFLYCYIIWLAVDWFDVFVLDMGILANWKKVRLPGQRIWIKNIGRIIGRASWKDS